jgi:hypothetical protein
MMKRSEQPCSPDEVKLRVFICLDQTGKTPRSIALKMEKSATVHQVIREVVGNLSDTVQTKQTFSMYVAMADGQPDPEIPVLQRQQKIGLFSHIVDQVRSPRTLTTRTYIARV